MTDLEPQPWVPAPDPREQVYDAWRAAHRELHDALQDIYKHRDITPAMIERVHDAEAAERDARAACFKIWSAPNLPG